MVEILPQLVFAVAALLTSAVSAIVALRQSSRQATSPVPLAGDHP
jgi:hypothetical protein